MLAEIADDQMDREGRVLLRKSRRRVTEEFVTYVEGYVRAQGAEVAERVEEDPGLFAGPRSELHQGVRFGELRDPWRVRFQQVPLGARRVVLGQAGDVLEELAPAFVVEPDGWDRFGVSLKAGNGVGSACVAGLRRGRHGRRWCRSWSVRDPGRVEGR